MMVKGGYRVIGPSYYGVIGTLVGKYKSKG